jgi:hypothetical protein
MGQGQNSGEERDGQRESEGNTGKSPQCCAHKFQDRGAVGCGSHSMQLDTARRPSKTSDAHAQKCSSTRPSEAAVVERASTGSGLKAGARHRAVSTSLLFCSLGALPFAEGAAGAANGASQKQAMFHHIPNMDPSLPGIGRRRICFVQRVGESQRAATRNGSTRIVHYVQSTNRTWNIRYCDRGVFPVLSEAARPAPHQQHLQCPFVGMMSVQVETFAAGLKLLTLSCCAPFEASASAKPQLGEKHVFRSVPSPLPKGAAGT